MMRYCYRCRGMTAHSAREKAPFGSDCVPCLRDDRTYVWAAVVTVVVSIAGLVVLVCFMAVR